MAEGCLLYYITDRCGFPGDERARRRLLLQKISEAAKAGVDCIQLRERDLTSRELERLAGEAASIVREVRAGDCKTKTKFLINSRTDVALAVGADGVHLRAEDVSPEQVRNAWARSGVAGGRGPVISVACHSPEEVSRAAKNGAGLALFAPVFGKKDAPGNMATGLAGLQRACDGRIPVLALGGVTWENAEACLRAGAAGVAGIRMFQESDVGARMRLLRELV